MKGEFNLKKLYTLIILLIGLILVGCTVTPSDTKLESIQVNKENITLFIGDSTAIEYEFVPNSISEEVTCHIENADNVFNMRLEDWLKADNFNFAHDVAGIVNNIDRRNPTDFNLFVPRFASN